MSLLHEIIKEINESAAAGVTGAGAIGGFRGSLFAGGAVNGKRSKRKMTNLHRLSSEEIEKTIKNRNAWKWRVIGEMLAEQSDEQFNPSDVMSKLDAAEKKAKQDTDTVPFGMEDEDGNIVKVYVRSDQADEFETALAALLAGEDENEDEISDSIEIAEVLFQLKDKFDIIDVEWPEIEGDVEEEQEVAGEEGAEGELDLEGGEEGLDLEGGEEGLEGEGELDLEGGEEGLEDLEGDMEMEPEGGAESALQQVIDMMKADAEARKAESEARAKEAEARAAEANANAAAAKVKQEEEVLDMETYNKQQKEEEEEAKRLAQLAKYKHQKASQAETRLSQEEEEAQLRNDIEPYRTDPREKEDRVLTKHELMQHMLDYLRAN